MRGTSRREQSLQEIESAGLEAAFADPDSPGTVLELCVDTAVVIWLLGSAEGEPDELAAIHGPRLERLMEKLVDSPVRGFVYEGVGSAPAEQLEGGREIVERAASTWRIPVACLDERGADPGWARRAAGVVAGLASG